MIFPILNYTACLIDKAVLDRYKKFKEQLVFTKTIENWSSYLRTWITIYFTTITFDQSKRRLQTSLK